MCNLSLIIWLSFLSICKAPLYTGNFIVSQSIYEFTYTTTTNAANVNFQLYLTSFYSAALLIGKNTPFTPSTNRQDWNHFDYLRDNSCDFEGMITGRNQYAYARNLGIGNIIYLKLINLEPTNTFNYTINITQGNFFLQSCPVGLIRQVSGYYCQFCDFGHIGSYCNVARNLLNPSTQAATILGPNSYTYFQLQTSGQISLYMASGNGVIIFIQVQSFNEQMAGIGHYLASSLGQGKYLYMQAMQMNLDLPEARTNYVVGIINPQSSTVGFTILFKEKESTNIIMIVIGVIGGLLLLGLVITIIIILRKIMKNRREVIPDGSLHERPRSNKLTSEQINFYFPALPLQQFFPQMSFEGSIIELKQEKLQEADKLQCVICLCEIQSQAMARAGYCKHVFHSNCLVEWFKKQQNCPYCRQNYERQPTKVLYKNLTFKTGKKLSGPQIPKAIFSKSEQMSINTIEITDISGQTYLH